MAAAEAKVKAADQKKTDLNTEMDDYFTDTPAAAETEAGEEAAAEEGTEEAAAAETPAEAADVTPAETPAEEATA